MHFIDRAAIDRIVAIVVTAVVFAVVALAGSLVPTPARADSPFSSWAAVVIAGDAHAHSGGPSDAFDNARRDVTRGLESIGFLPSHIRQFSTRPDRFASENVLPSDDRAIYSALKDLSREATGGCLVYFSSHGNRDGVVVGDSIMPPRELSQLLDETCGDRSTVVIISACFSGVFVPAIESPSRMVLTAARRDRSSFGCGEADKYPYFDTCFLAELPKAHDFPGLGRQVQDCVARREQETHASPPSEPQLSIGYDIAPMLRQYTFDHASAGVCGGSANSIAEPPNC